MGAIELIRDGVGTLLLALGLVFMLGGAIGVLRFPDFYTRLHAAGVSDAVGGVFLLLGLAVIAGDWRIALRLALLAALIVALAPTVAQLAANAAHAAGLAPLAGRYTAPRPGTRGEDAP
ncbi:monovalent cation/H(+) antiporter subunit G [Terricaulis sp.]|uniref:monovalent cation/H(+) antiporter subunit G n=1 Tax=Terricaulis sp. TaxID=2768686 RepID=UPI003783DAAC